MKESRERVYRAVAQKRSLFTESPLSNGSMRLNIHYCEPQTIHNLRHYRWIVLEGVSLSQDNQSLGRDLNLVPTEYQGIMLASSFVKTSYDS
jgi:hypothetical protein